jgi:cytochrome c oxidase subunit 2
VTAIATQLLGRTDLGSPHGVTTQDHWVRQLWHITYIFAIPIFIIVMGGIIWCVVRYRIRPGRERRPAQFQYHIPIEAAYTIIPLVIVAIVFGFMFRAENHVDHLTKNPAVKITVEGFQWGWRFTYPNGHMQYGSVYDELNINDFNNLPVLFMPSNETVQLHLISDDVVHTFYVKELLFQRDMIPGIDNTVDLNVKTPNELYGQCNNICGQYHAYMRFRIRVLSPADYNKWYAQQPPCSITTAGQRTQLRPGLTPGSLQCPTSLTTEHLTTEPPGPPEIREPRE